MPSSHCAILAPIFTRRQVLRNRRQMPEIGGKSVLVHAMQCENNGDPVTLKIVQCELGIRANAQDIVLSVPCSRQYHIFCSRNKLLQKC